jgi:hypothetical protein
VKPLVSLTAGPEESVTLTVKWNVPVLAGLPEMVPAADNARPAGRLPDATDQWYGGVPPAADRVIV